MSPRRLVDQQGRADLDDEPARASRGLRSWLRPPRAVFRSASASRASLDRSAKSARQRLVARRAPVTPDMSQHRPLRRALRACARFLRSSPRSTRVDLVERRRSRASRRGRGHRRSSSRADGALVADRHRPRCRRPDAGARRSARHGRGSGGRARRLRCAPSIRPGRSASTNSSSSTPHHAELRLQGGEGIVGDLRPGARDRGEQGRFAGIGQADQPGIGDQLQAQPDPALLAGPALVGAARRAVGRALEMRVAEAAIAALQQHVPLAGLASGRAARSRCPRRGSRCPTGTRSTTSSPSAPVRFAPMP